MKRFARGENRYSNGYGVSEISRFFSRSRLLWAMSQALALLGLIVPSHAFASTENSVASQVKNSASECIEFKNLPKVFATELSLDLKTAQIRFLPFEVPGLGSGSSASGMRKGFVLQNLESCGLRGSCDSMVFLSNSLSSGTSENSKASGTSGCYRGVFEFTGRWNGVVHAKNEKRAPASVRVDNRVFEWNEKLFRFEERVK